MWTKPSTEWIVIVMLMFFLIVAQAWKIYELSNIPTKVIYRCEHLKENRK